MNKQTISQNKNGFHKDEDSDATIVVVYFIEIMTMLFSKFCQRLYSDLLPTDSPGNRITPAASTRRNLELRNTETCGKYRRDINQSLLETFFSLFLFHIRYFDGD